MNKIKHDREMTFGVMRSGEEEVTPPGFAGEDGLAGCETPARRGGAEWINRAIVMGTNCTARKENLMSEFHDGPATPLFSPLHLGGSLRLDDLTTGQLSQAMLAALSDAARGRCTAWGIPFEVGGVTLVKDEVVSRALAPFKAGWLVFMHTADMRPLEENRHGFVSPMPGEGRLNAPAADYVMCYADGSEERAQIRMRHQVGMFAQRWGENCFQSVPADKPAPMRGRHEQPGFDWGWSQTRIARPPALRWTNWLWAWQNPHPEKEISGLRFEPRGETLVVSAVSAGEASEIPLRWRTRRKALLWLPEGVGFQAALDDFGRLAQIQLDMGQVISAQPRFAYPAEGWESSYENQLPERVGNEVLIEYTAHPDARFHLWDGQTLPVADVERGAPGQALQPVARAGKRVTLKFIERGARKPVAVKLHMHGAAGEYLPPVDRNRIINAEWFEDYSVDYMHEYRHPGSYVHGETVVDLPLGKVYAEVTKGFEIRPLRKVLEIAPETEEIIVELERVLPWREKGWVTADTHVHFLSPGSALLEGAGEGVNVVNLLASQWGELMTNVGDFDGRTNWGQMDTGGGPEGNGEYIVRVGTENRQHVLGHVSLLGYNGRIIAPMTNAGSDEAALGDPIDMLLTEWARQCKQQGGLVVLPHFPNPRAEHAASLVCGDIDAVEMTSLNNRYLGIDPYSLADWYRYLNCGYLVPAVGGTDKMWAGVAVGTVRTYARIAPGQPFTYQAWMDAVRRAETFVSYGPLLEFAVQGKPAGSRIQLNRGGGTLDVTWQAATATIPVTRVELVVNGEIRESQPLAAEGGSGAWRLKLERSAWIAILVRGHYPDQPEVIAAHSSPVMVEVEGAPLLAAGDAVTILEQIEGALAYLDTVGTRADDQAYKRMRLALTSAHRQLHNRLHHKGVFHEHSAAEDHHHT